MKRNIIKTFILSLLLVNLACGYAYGSFSSGNDDGLFRTEWTPLQFGLFSPAQLMESNVNVYGLSFLVLAGENYNHNIYGLDFAPVMEHRNCKDYSITMRLLGIFGTYYGLTSGFLNMDCDNVGVMLGGLNSLGQNQGVSLAAVNYSEDDNSGVMVGCFNCSRWGWQFGLLNYNESSVIQWTPLFNYSSKSEMMKKIDYRNQLIMNFLKQLFRDYKKIKFCLFTRIRG